MRGYLLFFIFGSFLAHFCPPPRAGCACGAVRVGPCVQGRAGPCVVHLLHIFGVFLMNFWRISGPLPACGPCVRGRACGTCVRPCQTVRGAFSDTFWFIFVSCGPCVRAGPCQAVRGYFVVSFLVHFWCIFGSFYSHVYICLRVDLHRYTYIYLYLYIYIYIYNCSCIFMYIYIYIYILDSHMAPYGA